MTESSDGDQVEDNRGMTAAKEFRTDPRADIAKMQSKVAIGIGIATPEQSHTKLTAHSSR